MILPTTNLSIIAVRNALNYPSTDLGTLCSVGSPYVNMWARYKPVRANFTYNRPADWWRGDLGNSGIHYTTYSGVQGAINAMNTGNVYSYEAPRGGITEPYRLGDFAGYDSDAIFPVYPVPLQDDINIGQTIATTVMLRNYSGNNVQLEEIFTPSFLTNYYYCIAIVKVGDTNPPKYITSDTAIGASNTFVGVWDVSGWTTGTYKVYYMFTDTKKTSQADPEPSNSTFYVIDGAIKQFVISNLEVSAIINVTRNSDGTNTGTVTITNNENVTVNLDAPRVTFKYGTSLPTDTIKPGEGIVIPTYNGTPTTTTLAVPANSTITLNIPVNSYLPNLSVSTGMGYAQFADADRLVTATIGLYVTTNNQ